VIDIENYCVCKQKYMNEDLTSLIKQHQKDIWEWKQKESQWTRDKNQLDGNKRIIEELSTKIVELGKKVREAEGETSIVKAVGLNSPEVKELNDRLASALDINDEHQRYNGKLQTQLTEALDDNKKLAMQIADLNTRKY